MEPHDGRLYHTAATVLVTACMSILQRKSKVRPGKKDGVPPRLRWRNGKANRKIWVSVRFEIVMVRTMIHRYPLHGTVHAPGLTLRISYECVYARCHFSRLCAICPVNVRRPVPPALGKLQTHRVGFSKNDRRRSHGICQPVAKLASVGARYCSCIDDTVGQQTNSETQTFRVSSIPTVVCAAPVILAYEAIGSRGEI